MQPIFLDLSLQKIKRVPNEKYTHTVGKQTPRNQTFMPPNPTTRTQHNTKGKNSISQKPSYNTIQRLRPLGKQIIIKKLPQPQQTLYNKETPFITWNNSASVMNHWSKILPPSPSSPIFTYRPQNFRQPRAGRSLWKLASNLVLKAGPSNRIAYPRLLQAWSRTTSRAGNSTTSNICFSLQRFFFPIMWVSIQDMG